MVLATLPQNHVTEAGEASDRQMIGGTERLLWEDRVKRFSMFTLDGRLIREDMI